jgi:hypothetical protein
VTGWVRIIYRKVLHCLRLKVMKKILVEIRHKKALQILKDLEGVNLIKLIPSEPKKRILSKSLRGSLSKKKAVDLEKQLNSMRNEWRRSI